MSPWCKTSQGGDTSCSQVSLLIWIFKHSWVRFILLLSVFTRSYDSLNMTGVSNAPPDTPHTRRSRTNIPWWWCFFILVPAEARPCGCSVLHKHASDFQVQACALISTTVTWRWRGRSSSSLCFALHSSADLSCSTSSGGEVRVGWVRPRFREIVFKNWGLRSSRSSQSGESSHWKLLCTRMSQVSFIYNDYAEQRGTHTAT